MSNLYHLEPQPTAKVVLQTTAGDISLELFAKQTPLASRNFLQHCLDGYYNGTIFHRLVPGFIVQGGDPTGTGASGESAIDNGEPFADEFHSRLKYNRRGLLGMANEGKDSNGSQFFLTLAATPELQNTNTLFGRVEGDTIYNLMKMADVELVEGEGSERPLYPTKITGAEILVNPFEDMVARARVAPRTNAVTAEKSTKKRKKPAGKNVLSFNAEEGEDDIAAPNLKKSKANPKLVSLQSDVQDSPQERKMSRTKRKNVKEQSNQRSPSRSLQEGTEEDRKIQRPATQPQPEALLVNQRSPSPDIREAPAKLSALERTNAEIAAIKASMRRQIDKPIVDREKPKNALEAMIPATSTRGRKRGKAADEKGALNMFNAFKHRLQDLPQDGKSRKASDSYKAPDTVDVRVEHPQSKGDNAGDDEEAELCDLHFIAGCQSCKSWDQEALNGEAEVDGDDDGAWMTHQLAFAKDTLGKDLEWKRKMAEIEVIDPREKAKTIKEERKRGKHSKTTLKSS